MRCAVNMKIILFIRLTKAEARLSQSEDENKKLREDLKDMLAAHTELQMQLLLDQKELADKVNISCSI